MTRSPRCLRRLLLGALMAWTAPSGCASAPQPNATHDAGLLDNKVTAARVHAALKKAGPQFEHVHVQASSEGITLTGDVESSEARSRAEDIARSVNSGVTVTNQLSVR